MQFAVFFEAVELRNGTDNANAEQRKTRKKVICNFVISLLNFCIEKIFYGV